MSLKSRLVKYLVAMRAVMVSMRVVTASESISSERVVNNALT